MDFQKFFRGLHNQHFDVQWKQECSKYRKRIQGCLFNYANKITQMHLECLFNNSATISPFSIQEAAKLINWLPVRMKFPIEPEFPPVLIERLKKYIFKLILEGSYNEKTSKELCMIEYVNNIEELNIPINFEGGIESFWYQAIYNQFSIYSEISPPEFYRKQLTLRYLDAKRLDLSQIYNMGQHTLKINVRNTKETVNIVAMVRMDGKKYTLFLPVPPGKKPMYRIENLHFCEVDEIPYGVSPEIFQSALEYFARNINYPLQEAKLNTDMTPIHYSISTNANANSNTDLQPLMKSQLFLESSFAQAKGINFYCFEMQFLLPNFTKEVQPLDCGIFDLLERKYWAQQRNENTQAEQNNFPSLEAAYTWLATVWTNCITETVTSGGFREAFGTAFYNFIESGKVDASLISETSTKMESQPVGASASCFAISNPGISNSNCDALKVSSI